MVLNFQSSTFTQFTLKDWCCAITVQDKNYTDHIAYGHTRKNNINGDPELLGQLLGVATVCQHNQN